MTLFSHYKSKLNITKIYYIPNLILHKIVKTDFNIYFYILIFVKIYFFCFSSLKIKKIRPFWRNIEKSNHQIALKKFQKFSLLIIYFDSKFYADSNGVIKFLRHSCPKIQVLAPTYMSIIWKNSIPKFVWWGGL